MNNTDAKPTTDDRPIWLTAKETAILLGVSKAALHKNRNKFANKDAPGSGGTRRLFLLSSLPQDFQKKHYDSLQPQTGLQPAFSGLAVPGLPLPGLSVSGRGGIGLPVHPSSEVPEKLKKIALARFDLVQAWTQHRQPHKKEHKLSGIDADFVLAYKRGGVLPNVFAVLDAVALRTLQDWHKKLDGSSDWTLLIPQWNCRREEPSLLPEEKGIFQDCLLHPNKLNIGEATRITRAVLAKKGLSSSSSDRTFRRWAEWLKSGNSHIWTLMREGQKALLDKEIFSIKRDASKLEVGDVFVADGTRLNFKVKHPFTGTPCRATLVGYLDWKSWDLAGYEIMVEENTQCIASALRNSIIRLGKMPKISYQDNGKSFVGRYYTGDINLEECGFYGLFGRLGIIPVFTMKYRSKSKPIERFWKEFAGKFQRLLPSFTGSSIEDKPAHMRMGETFHKAIHDEYVPTIEEVKEWIDIWIQDYFEKQPCPHVKGKTIGEAFREGQGPGVDIASLDDLMLATDIKQIRANGIRFLGGDYYSDALFGLREQVIIKYSLSDLSNVRVYERSGRFLCTAKRVVSVHPMANYLGDARDVAEVKHLQNKQRSLQKAVVKAAKELIPNKQALPPWSDIVPMTPKTIQQIEDAQAGTAPPPASEETHIPDFMLKRNQVKEPSPVVSQSEGRPHEAEGAEQQIDPSRQAEETPTRPDFGMDLIPRYEWHLKYGCLTKEDEAWVIWFKTTAAYRDGCLFFEGQTEEYQRSKENRGSGT